MSAARPETPATGKLLRAAPILLVRDVRASAEYWREKVGFTEISLHNDPPDFLIARRGDVAIMCAQCANPSTPHWRVVPMMWNAYVWVEDARTLYEELRARGARIDYELHEKPYGCLEFGIQDLDDHDIAFGQVI